MKTDELEKHSIFRWGIVKKFILYILLFSSVITLILIVIQLYMDYRYGLDSIEKSINQIEVSYLDGIRTSLWVSDPELLQIQLEGMLQLSDLQYLDVVHNNRTLAKVGELQDKHVITKDFSLSYTYSNKTISLGRLRVVYTLKDLYNRLMKKAIVITISQSIKTFMVSGFIFFIFYLLVARHLHAMANYTASLDLKTLKRPFILKRNQNNRKKDEFDMLAKAINEMRMNLHESYHQLQGEMSKRKRSEETLQIERDNLRSMFESIEDGVYLVNRQYDIQYVNPVLVKDFGPYEGIKCYRYLHDRDEVCPWCKNKDVQAGKTVQWEWHSSKNGKTYDLLDTPMTLPDGSTGKLEIFRDITERKKAEAELEKYQKHLETLVKEKTDELEEKVTELERMNDVFVGREFRIKELRDRVKELEESKEKLKNLGI